jgi:hypothetical protein
VVPRYEPQTWVLVLDQAEHLGDQVPELPFVTDDATALHDTFHFRYRVPEGQLQRARDLSAEQFRVAVATFAQRATPDSQLIVCFLGLGTIQADGKPLLAANDFDSQRVDDTSIPLTWLLQQLEASPAKEKLLLLCTGAPTSDGNANVKLASALELAEAARTRPRRPLSSSVNVLAASGEGETYVVSPERKRSVFALSLERAFAGAADVVPDQRISAAELAGFIPAETSRLAGEIGQKQTATLISADPNPPRISEMAREAVAMLLFKLTQPIREVSRMEYEAAAKVSPGQPDADIAFGLLLMRQDKSPLAMEVFDRVLAEHPQAVVPYQCSAWLRARRGDFKECLPMLEQMVRRMPASADPADKAYAEHALHFAGRLAAYLLIVVPEERRIARSDLAGLEKALKERGPDAQSFFTAGARSIRAQVQELNTQISEAPTPSDKSRLEGKLTNFNHYLPFDFDAVRQFLLANLDR